jgi:hypothetical protein
MLSISLSRKTPETNPKRLCIIKKANMTEPERIRPRHRVWDTKFILNSSRLFVKNRKEKDESR